MRTGEDYQTAKIKSAIKKKIDNSAAKIGT